MPQLELDMDFLKSLISDFDLMALLPEMADLLDWIMMIVSYALIIGPCVLALLGMWYFLLPTREANHYVGYRFFWGMGSIKSWKFTQRLAGLAWVILGAYLAKTANDLRESLMAMEKLDMMYEAVVLIVKQISWIVVTCLSINAVVFVIFDFKGNIRRIWRMLGSFIKKLFTKDKTVKEKKDKKKEKKQPKEEKAVQEPVKEPVNQPAQESIVEPVVEPAANPAEPENQ